MLKTANHILLAVLLAVALWDPSPVAGAERSLKGSGKLYGDAGRGGAIVDRWCANCHALGDSQNDRVPSLRALANNSEKTEGYIRAFLMVPHKPMPPVSLSSQEIEDIIAYIKTLASKTP